MFCSSRLDMMYDMLTLQEVIEGYQSLSSQLVQDYNVHSATVLGPPVSAVPKQQAAAAGPSSSAAAAAPPGEVDSEMTEAEAQQYRQNAGELTLLICMLWI